MKFLIEQITELLQQANTLAETLDNFKVSTASVTIECTDGRELVINDSLHDYGDGTIGEGTSANVTPPRPRLIDQLGAIKTNVWF
jgi:hypothetical protein